jgi:hypothetical protein
MYDVLCQHCGGMFLLSFEGAAYCPSSFLSVFGSLLDNYHITDMHLCNPLSCTCKHMCAGRLVVLVMMLVGVVLIPVRASQLYSRLNERRLMSGHPPVSSNVT